MLDETASRLHMDQLPLVEPSQHVHIAARRRASTSVASLDFTDPPSLVSAVASQDRSDSRCVISSYMLRSARHSLPDNAMAQGCFGLPGAPTNACQFYIAVNGRTRLPLARLTVHGNRYIREMVHADADPQIPSLALFGCGEGSPLRHGMCSTGAYALI